MADGDGWKVWFGAALLAALFASSTLAQLSGLLQGMHLPGQGSFGIESTSALVTVKGRFDLTSQIVGTWAQFSAHVADQVVRSAGHTVVLAGFASVRQVAAIDLVIDSVLFAPAYGLVLVLLLAQMRRGLRCWPVTPATDERAERASGQGGDPPTDRPGPYWDALSLEIVRSREIVRNKAYERLATFAMGTVAVAVLADWLENVMTWVVIRGFWPPVTGSHGWLTAASGALWLFSVVKWAALALVALAAVLLVTRLWSLYPDVARLSELRFGAPWD